MGLGQGGQGHAFLLCFSTHYSKSYNFNNLTGSIFHHTKGPSMNCDFALLKCLFNQDLLIKIKEVKRQRWVLNTSHLVFDLGWCSSTRKDLLLQSTEM